MSRQRRECEGSLFIQVVMVQKPNHVHLMQKYRQFGTTAMTDHSQQCPGREFSHRVSLERTMLKQFRDLWALWALQFLERISVAVKRDLTNKKSKGMPDLAALCLVIHAPCRCLPGIYCRSVFCRHLHSIFRKIPEIISVINIACLQNISCYKTASSVDLVGNLVDRILSAFSSDYLRFDITKQANELTKGLMVCVLQIERRV